MESISPIESVLVTANINELFATTEVKQTFTNERKENLEISVSFPLKKETILKSFNVKIGDKTVYSKIMEKEKAEEKYADSIASGNTGILGRYSEEDSYKVTIGNLAPGENLIFTSEFIQLITQEDKSYQYAFSLADLPKILTHNSNLIGGNVITMFCAQLKTNSKITRLVSPSHCQNMLREIKECCKMADIGLSRDNLTNKKEVVILFRTEEMNKFQLNEQYDPILKIYSYTLQLVLDLREREKNIKEPDMDDSKIYFQLYEANEINESPGVFIFLVDQSGSMGGKSIEIAEESIKLFLQSLPANSYFDIIGFGCEFRSYNKEPLFYDSKNVSQLLSEIKGLKADLGGTDIYKPLEFVYCGRKYNNFFSKNIFLLTDGEVGNNQKCIDLIKEHSKDFRVHAIGIGNSVDKTFIENSGKSGKGSFLFAPEVKNLRKQVIQALNSALRPYINNLKVSIDETEKIVEYPPTSANNLVYNDEIFTYSFVCPNKLNETTLIKISTFYPVKNMTLDTEFKVGDILHSLEDGNSLSKAIVGNVIKNSEEFKLSKDEIIKLSTKFQVASKETSLFAEVIKDNSIQSEILKVEVISYECGKFFETAWKGGLGFIKVGTKRIQRSASFSPKMKKENSYSDLIIAQNMFDGSWDSNSPRTKYVISKHQDSYSKLESYLKGYNNLNQSDIATLAATILVVIVLIEEFSNKKEEYLLIVNKAKKFIIGKGVNFDLAVKAAK